MPKGWGKAPAPAKLTFHASTMSGPTVSVQMEFRQLLAALKMKLREALDLPSSAPLRLVYKGESLELSDHDCLAESASFKDLPDGSDVDISVMVTSLMVRRHIYEGTTKPLFSCQRFAYLASDDVELNATLSLHDQRDAIVPKDGLNGGTRWLRDVDTKLAIFSENEVPEVWDREIRSAPPGSDGEFMMSKPNAFTIKPVGEVFADNCKSFVALIPNRDAGKDMYSEADQEYLSVVA